MKTARAFMSFVRIKRARRALIEVAEHFGEGPDADYFMSLANGIKSRYANYPEFLNVIDVLTDPPNLSDFEPSEAIKKRFDYP